MFPAPACPPCERGWRHCHGTLIVHGDGRTECSEHGCAEQEDAHLDVVACAELSGGCGCP